MTSGSINCSVELKHLQGMLRRRREGPSTPTKVKQIMEKYHRLPPEVQKIVEATVDRLLERRQ
jgi:hypothetical protein